MPVSLFGGPARLKYTGLSWTGARLRAPYIGVPPGRQYRSPFGKTGLLVQEKHQNWPALASSTSTLSSISDRTTSRPGSPEEDFRLAAASRSRLRVEASKLPDSKPILRSSSTSS